MAHKTDPTDNILNQFSRINFSEPITDAQLLDILNELRAFETRPALQTLPRGIQTLTQSQKYALLQRCSREINVHQKLSNEYKDKEIPYPKVLFLNKTESLLLSTNLQAPTYPLITSLPFDSISATDRSLYYPPGTDTSLPVFITDTPCSYINTPTYSTRFDCFIAQHNIPTPVNSGSRSSIVPLLASTSDEHDQEVSQESTEDTDNRDVLNSTVKQKSTKRQRPDFSFFSTKTISKESIIRRFKRKPKMPEDAETERIKELELKNATLTGQLETLKTGKQRAKTEREEIQQLEAKLNRLTDLFEKQLLIPSDSITVESKDDTIGASYPVIYHLQKPTNVIKGTRTQGSLSAIKPTTLLATIGPFDPDTDTKIDFKKFWDRITDYLRPYELYEHEYIQCLLTLMKGSAADVITDMNKQYKGDLNRILEALQDLFLPQNSIFDDYDELNQFKRKANEHIRTTVRRAMILVWKLEHTVSPAAWPDRQYHLVVNIIKQVIDKKTFRHLRSKELECAQAGTELSISAITDIIALYEVSQELTPPNDIPIKFNVNTMQLTDQPDVAQTQFQELQNDIQALTATVKSLEPKRQRTETGKYPDRQKAFAKRKLSQPITRTPSVKRPYENDTPKTEAKPAYDKNRSYNNQRTSRYDGYGRHEGYNKQRTSYGDYEKRSYRDRYRSRSGNRYSDYRSSSRNRYRSSTPRPRSVSFNDRKTGYNNKYSYNQRNKHESGRAKYTLNLYKCSFCKEEHEKGTYCEAHPRTQNLNTNRRH